MKIQKLPDDFAEFLRDASKALLGNRYRLELGLSLGAGEPRVFAHELAKGLGLPDRTVGEELRRLASVGLLRPLEDREPGQFRIYYDRIPSCHWENLERLRDELLARMETEQTRRAQLRRV